MIFVVANIQISNANFNALSLTFINTIFISIFTIYWFIIDYIYNLKYIFNEITN